MTGKGTQRFVKMLIRKTVELAAVCMGFCILAALAALNVPALLACLLLENVLLGLWGYSDTKKPLRCCNTETAKAVIFEQVTASNIAKLEVKVNEQK